VEVCQAHRISKAAGKLILKNEKSIVLQLVDKFPVCYGIKRFIAMFTSACHWLLCTLFSKIHFRTTLHSAAGSPKWSLPFRLLDEMFYSTCRFWIVNGITHSPHLFFVNVFDLSLLFPNLWNLPLSKNILFMSCLYTGILIFSFNLVTRDVNSAKRLIYMLFLKSCFGRSFTLY
jgi:hypothetical protein